MRTNLCESALLQIVVWLPGLVATGFRLEFSFIYGDDCPLIYSVSQNRKLVIGFPSIYSIFLSLHAFVCKIWLVVASSAKDNNVEPIQIFSGLKRKSFNNAYTSAICDECRVICWNSRYTEITEDTKKVNNC